MRFTKRPNGRVPFNDWMQRFKEFDTRSKVITRLDRLKLGNFGDCKSVGEGVAELRIHYGPGLRIYYSKIESKIIVLLVGGDKSTQSADISRAVEFLREYQSREEK